MNQYHLEEIALLVLTLLFGLLAVVTWKAVVLWNGLARSLTVLNASLALAAFYFWAVIPFPSLLYKWLASGIWLLLIVTGVTAIYHVQRETRRSHGAYAVAQAREVVQQSIETARLANETQRVADETSRVADAAEGLTITTAAEVLNTAATAAAQVLNTAATKAAEVLTTADNAASKREGTR